MFSNFLYIFKKPLHSQPARNMFLRLPELINTDLVIFFQNNHRQRAKI